MDLNLEKGYVKIENFKISINDLESVEKICFNFKGHSLPMLYICDGQYLFMYSDMDTYKKVLKAISIGGIDVERELIKCSYDNSIEFELWKQLLPATGNRYHIDHGKMQARIGSEEMSSKAREMKNIELSRFLELLDYDSYDVRIAEVQDIDAAYNLFNSILPENLPNTLQEYQKKKAMTYFEPIIAICGTNFENKEAYILQLEEQNALKPEKWISSIMSLKKLRTNLSDYLNRGYLDEIFSLNANEFLAYCLDYAEGKLKTINRENLLRKYGPVSALKKNLRDSINQLDFQGLLELHREYKNEEKVLESKARLYSIDSDEFTYKQYLDIYRLGSILISDKMNSLNKIKAKRKFISQDLLDEAMVFYYDTDTAEDAYSAFDDEKYQQDKESGDIGERKVEYALKWLDQTYTKIERRSKDRVGNECILIANPAYIDEKQEYDHIIVSNKGIFNIETKNYVGKLTIDQYGNWIRKKNDKEEGIKNPLQQIRQHEKVLSSFLPKEFKIISVICIANDKAIIEGAENCIIPIVKSDMLVEYIENYSDTECNLSDMQKQQCIEEIYNHMI